MTEKPVQGALPADWAALAENMGPAVTLTWRDPQLEAPGYWLIVCTCGWFTERQTNRGAVLAAEIHGRICSGVPF